MYTLEISNRRHYTAFDIRTEDEARRIAGELVAAGAPGVRIILADREVAYVAGARIAVNA